MKKNLKNFRINKNLIIFDNVSLKHIFFLFFLKGARYIKKIELKNFVIILCIYKNRKIIVINKNFKNHLLNYKFNLILLNEKLKFKKNNKITKKNKIKFINKLYIFVLKNLVKNKFKKIDLLIKFLKILNEYKILININPTLNIDFLYKNLFFFIIKNK